MSDSAPVRPGSDDRVAIPIGVLSQAHSVVHVAFAIFRDPTRRIDRAFFEGLGPTYRGPMTRRTYRKALATLEAMGILEGDRVRPEIIDGWRAAWRQDGAR